MGSSQTMPSTRDPDSRSRRTRSSTGAPATPISATTSVEVALQAPLRPRTGADASTYCSSSSISTFFASIDATVSSSEVSTRSSRFCRPVGDAAVEDRSDDHPDRERQEERDGRHDVEAEGDHRQENRPVREYQRSRRSSQTVRMQQLERVGHERHGQR